MEKKATRTKQKYASEERCQFILSRVHMLSEISPRYVLPFGFLSGDDLVKDGGLGDVVVGE